MAVSTWNTCDNFVFEGQGGESFSFKSKQLLKLIAISRVSIRVLFNNKLTYCAAKNGDNEGAAHCSVIWRNCNAYS